MAGAAGAPGYQVLVSGRDVREQAFTCVFERMCDVSGCIHLNTVTLNPPTSKALDKGKKVCVCGFVCIRIYLHMSSLYDLFVYRGEGQRTENRLLFLPISYILYFFLFFFS